jgi:DNA adenine methylase
MGGKFRQSKAIVECLRPVINPETVYVEPFCGGMWSATRVIRDLNPKVSILNDINKPLMMLWDKCIKEGVDWLPTDQQIIEDNYQKYKREQNMDDPLTAWYGAAVSFGGKWFGGVARKVKGNEQDWYKADQRSIGRKVDILRSANLMLYSYDYQQLSIPDDSVVYCDPPYEGRTKAHNFQGFDYSAFWQWVRELSKRCFVLTSCFDCPDDFRPIYQWGDTVVRHHNSKGTDGTNEKLVILK